MPCKRKRTTVRFPPARIKKIMQKDEEIGKVAASVPIIISRTLELFLESFLKKTHSYAKEHNAKTLSAEHIKGMISCEQVYKFLLPLMEDIKVESDDNTEEKVVRDSSTKVKRGRPKKVKTDDSVDSKDTGESDTEISAGPSSKKATPSHKTEYIKIGHYSKENSTSTTTSVKDDRKEVKVKLESPPPLMVIDEGEEDEDKQLKDKQEDDQRLQIDESGEVNAEEVKAEEVITPTPANTLNSLDCKDLDLITTTVSLQCGDQKPKDSDDKVLMKKYSSDFRERKLKLDRVPSFSNMQQANDVAPVVVTPAAVAPTKQEVATPEPIAKIESHPTNEIARSSPRAEEPNKKEKLYLPPTNSVEEKPKEPAPKSAFSGSPLKPHSMPYQMNFSSAPTPAFRNAAPPIDNPHTPAFNPSKPLALGPLHQQGAPLPSHHLIAPTPMQPSPPIHRPLPLHKSVILQSSGLPASSLRLEHPPSPHLHPVPMQLEHKQHSPSLRLEHPPQSHQHAPLRLEHPPPSHQHAPLRLEHPPPSHQHAPLRLEHPPPSHHHAPLRLEHPHPSHHHAPLRLDHPPQSHHHAPLRLDHQPPYHNHAHLRLEHPPPSHHHAPLRLDHPPQVSHPIVAPLRLENHHPHHTQQHQHQLPSPQSRDMLVQACYSRGGGDSRYSPKVDAKHPAPPPPTLQTPPPHQPPPPPSHAIAHPIPVNYSRDPALIRETPPLTPRFSAYQHTPSTADLPTNLSMRMAAAAAPHRDQQFNHDPSYGYYATCVM